MKRVGQLSFGISFDLKCIGIPSSIKESDKILLVDPDRAYEHNGPKSYMFVTVLLKCLTHSRIQNADPDRARLPEKFGAQRCIICICFCHRNSVLWIFFLEIALGHGPKQWHIV